jgi:hypothetical protein
LVCKQAPARAIEPKRLGEPTSLVEEQVQVSVDGVETDAAHGTGDGVERAAHVERLDRHEHPHRGW